MQNLAGFVQKKNFGSRCFIPEHTGGA